MFTCSSGDIQHVPLLETVFGPDLAGLLVCVLGSALVK